MDHLDLFAAEQQHRAAGDLRAADRLVCHRAAIVSAGERSLRDGYSLRCLDPEAMPAQAIWGHIGGVVDALVVDGQLVTIGADHRLRLWSAEGHCRGDVALEGTALLVGPSGLLCARPSGDLVQIGEDGTLGAEITGLPPGRIASRDRGFIVLTDDAVFLLDSAGTVTAEAALSDVESERYRYVSGVSLLPDGRMVIEQSEDDPGNLYGPERSWSVWDPLTGHHTPTTAPAAPVLRLGELVVHPMPDGHLRLQPPGVPARPAPQHERPVEVVALSPAHLISAQRGASVRLHIRDARTGVALRQTERHSDLAGITIGARVVSHSRYVHADVRAPSAKVWDLETGACLRTVEAGQNYAALMSVSPDGARLAWTREETLCLASTDHPEEAVTLRLPWQWRRTVHWSCDGDTLLAQLRGTAVALWDLSAGTRTLLSTEVIDSATVGLSADDAVVLADWSFYALCAVRLDGERVGRVAPGFTLRTLAAGEGGRLGIAGGTQGKLRWMDLRAGTSRVLAEELGFISATAARGDVAVWGAGAGLSDSGSLGLVALSEAAIRWCWRGAEIAAVALSETMVFAGDERGMVHVLSCDDGAVLHRWRADAVRCGAVALLSDGRLLTGGQDGAVRAWQPDGTGGEVIGQEAGAILGLSVRGGRVLVSLGQAQVLRTLEGWSPLSLPSRMGRALLVGDGTRAVSLDPIFRLERIEAATAKATTLAEWGAWDLADALLPSPEGLLALQGGALCCVDRWRVPGDFRALRRIGDRLIAASETSVSAFTLEGEQLWQVTMPDSIRDIAADAAHTVAVGPGFVVVLKTADGAPVGQWRADSPWLRCALCGDRVAAGDAEGRVHLWALGG